MKKENKTLTDLQKCYSIMYTASQGFSFNTETCKRFFQNRNEAILFGVSIKHGVKVGVIKHHSLGVYTFTKRPSENDVYNIYQSHRSECIERYNKRKETKTNTPKVKNEYFIPTSVMLHEASIQQIVNRIKELGYTGELTPIKQTILIN